jgi:hypothetical protein
VGFVPMSKRGTPEAEKHLALDDGVPAHLQTALLEWVQGEVITSQMTAWASTEPAVSSQYLRGIELDMQVDLGVSREEMATNLFRKAGSDSQWFIDLLDYLLRHPLQEVYSGRRPRERAYRLETILDRGRSAWRVVDIGDGRCALERRIDPTIEEAINETASINPTAGHHLYRAWQLAYSRTPNAAESYRESIKAVEVAAIAVICPAHAKATLGSVLGDMRNNIGKWTVEVPATSEAMPDEKLVIEMVSSLWNGQVGRHGSPAPAVPSTQTLSEAQAAVHLAATLVQWFSSGVIR